MEPECLLRREAPWSMLLRCIIIHAARFSLVIVSNRRVPGGTSSHCLRRGLVRGRSFVRCARGISVDGDGVCRGKLLSQIWGVISHQARWMVVVDTGSDITTGCITL